MMFGPNIRIIGEVDGVKEECQEWMLGQNT